jgi:hypothetical protein
MSYLRYGIVLLTLLILSDSFSFVLAISIYDYKRKSSSTVRPFSTDTPEKNRFSIIPGGSPYLILNPNMKFRYLSGTYTSDLLEAASSTYSIIWEGFGIGQSVFKKKGIISGVTYDIENKSIDLSYTFGDEYTLTFGSSTVYSGKFIGTTSDGQKYNSTNVFGYGHFSIFGVEYGIFEILLGYQFVKYAYLDLESESTAIYWSSFNDSGSLYLLGIGIVF